MILTVRNTVALKLPPGKTDHIEFDSKIPGFGLRLRDAGSRTWIFQYSIGSKQRRIVIGRASAITPDAARSIAADLYAKVRLGGDPAADKAMGKAAAALSFKAVADRYLARQRTRLRSRSYVEVERHILKYAAPFHGMPIASVGQRNIAARLGELADTNGNVAANRARATWSALFSWAMKEAIATNNPVALTNKQGEERARDRVLSDVELAAIWRACRDDDHGRIIKLLMLTAQRATEISALRRSEVDLDKRMIELSAARTKNARPHQIPISDAVAAILAEQLKIEGRDLLFGYDNDHPFQGWTFAQKQLNARIAEITGEPLPHWTPHDLRRTAATRMADLGIAPPHVIEAILNHVSGHRAGIAGIYNKSLYTNERTQALAIWADHIASLIEQRPNKLAVLKKRSA